MRFTSNSLAGALTFLVAGLVATLGAVPASSRSVPNQYVQRNLASDIPGVALNTDPRLKNPWGIAWLPHGPFWIANNADGMSTLYDKLGHAQPYGIQIPGPTSGGVAPHGGAPAGTPTGVVANPSSDFNGDAFIFAGEDGIISGWKAGTAAAVRVDGSLYNYVYTGLALGKSGGQNQLYAADFRSGVVRVYNKNYGYSMMKGGFVDPNAEAGYAPFNIVNIAGKLYVAYAKQGMGDTEDGPGNGYINVFNPDGSFVKRFATGTSITNGTVSAFNSPWGMAMAPSGFGKFGGDLLVANFGSGQIAAFKPNGKFAGLLGDTKSQPISIDGIWDVKFGDGRTGDKNTLYFTAGLLDETHGLFGSLRSVK